MRAVAVAAAALAFIAVPALAQERDYCPVRPGLGTPACTIAPGRVSIETGLIDWQRDDTFDERTDTMLIGDTLVRVGLSDTIEAQIGWTPFGHVRSRDKTSGRSDRVDRIGDVTLGAKLNLESPDGSDLSIAVQPYVTVPVGRRPIGAGDWGGGVLIPLSYDLSDTLNLQFTPEADAAVDKDGSGRHFAYGGTVGLGVAISDAVSGTIELQALRDDDPAGRTTQTLLALSLGWMPKDDLQIDVGGVTGLDRDAPDAEVYVGVAKRL